MKMYAALTTQGTAAAETALCENHVGDLEALAQAFVNAGDDVPVDQKPHDCSGNDALSCIVCGIRSS